MNTFKKLFPYLFAILLFLLIWHMSYRLEGHEIIIPSISSTFSKVVNILTSNYFIDILQSTIIRTILGFILSLSFGILLGFIAGLFVQFENFMKTYIVLIKSTPTVAIMLLDLIYVNSSNVPILVNFLICFPIIYQEVITAIRKTDKNILKYAKIHKLSMKTKLKYIYIPHTFSYIYSGILTTLSFSFKITISSEILSLPKSGIGTSIYDAKIYLNMAEVFAWLIIVFVICFVLDSIVHLIKNKISRSELHANKVK